MSTPRRERPSATDIAGVPHELRPTRPARHVHHLGIRCPTSSRRIPEVGSLMDAAKAADDEEERSAVNAFRYHTGAGSGPPTPRNGSTKRSSAAPASWESSLTTPPSSASSAPPATGRHRRTRPRSPPHHGRGWAISLRRGIGASCAATRYRSAASRLRHRPPRVLNTTATTIAPSATPSGLRNLKSRTSHRDERRLCILSRCRSAA